MKGDDGNVSRQTDDIATTDLFYVSVTIALSSSAHGVLCQKEREWRTTARVLPGEKEKKYASSSIHGKSRFSLLLSWRCFFLDRSVALTDLFRPSMMSMQREGKNVPCRRKKAMSEVERWPKSILPFLYGRVDLFRGRLTALIFYLCAACLNGSDCFAHLSCQPKDWTKGCALCHGRKLLDNDALFRSVDVCIERQVSRSETTREGTNRIAEVQWWSRGCDLLCFILQRDRLLCRV